MNSDLDKNIPRRVETERGKEGGGEGEDDNKTLKEVEPTNQHNTLGNRTPQGAQTKHAVRTQVGGSGRGKGKERGGGEGEDDKKDF
jgi:hypothetical protein